MPTGSKKVRKLGQGVKKIPIFWGKYTLVFKDSHATMCKKTLKSLFLSKIKLKGVARHPQNTDLFKF